MSLNLSPFQKVVILIWVEFDGAVEVGQGLVGALHRPVGPAAPAECRGVLGIEFDGTAEVGQGVVVAPIFR
jgi:hypothetical protein